MKNTLDFYKDIYDPLFKKRYTKTSNRGKPALKKFREFMKKNDVEIKNMIDVGCAWGKTLEYWENKKVKAYGVDVSKETVAYCQKKKFRCYLASATDLSIFKNNKFDLYMATDVYEHLRTEDLDYAMKEAIRITKKYLVIRPHPVLDKRKTLHLTVWELSKWEDFFKKYNLNIIPIGDNGETVYKNVFLMEVRRNIDG